jgi:regulator of ribonuclease activity A
MAFKTADICDENASSLQIVEPGFLDYGGLKVFSGAIATVKCFEDNSFVREQLSQPGDGRVLVVDAGGSPRCAMLGDMLAAMGVDNGWTGVVMYGMIRDSHEIGQMALGVKALGTHPKKSEKRQTGEIGIELRFHGVVFRPGDYLYADHDGIIVSSNALAVNS